MVAMPQARRDMVAMPQVSQMAVSGGWRKKELSPGGGGLRAGFWARSTMMVGWGRLAAPFAERVPCDRWR